METEIAALLRSALFKAGPYQGQLVKIRPIRAGLIRADKVQNASNLDGPVPLPVSARAAVRKNSLETKLEMK